MTTLDTLATLVVRNPAQRNRHGEMEDGAATFSGNVWTFVTDRLAQPQPTPAGVLLSASRTFRIRWRQDVATIKDATNRLDLTHEGETWEPVSITESDDRRRYLDLHCVRRV